MKTTTLTLTLCLLTLSGGAAAQEADAAAPAPKAAADHGALLVGAKAGAALPLDGLGPSPAGILEVGYLGPWKNRSFAAVVDVSFAAPSQTGTGKDPRLGGAYTWELSEKMLTIQPTLMYRLTSLGRVVPYAGVGPRIYLLQSTVTGSAHGQAFGETTEQSTEVGVGVPLGAELKLGPGSLLGEVSFEWGPLAHAATGDSSTMSVGVLLGYRLAI